MMLRLDPPLPVVTPQGKGLAHRDARTGGHAMKQTDHKAVLRALAAEDGCQASLKAAAHIEYIERQLTSARDYEEQLRRRLAKTRHQRDELRRQLTEKENVGSNWNDDSHPGRSAGLGCDVRGVLSGVEGSVP